MIDKIMLLYLELQYLCYMVQYDIPYPPNAAIYNQYMINLLEFKQLNPENVIQRFYPEFSYQSFITGTKEKVSSFSQFNQIITMTSVLILVIIPLLILLLFPKT